MRSCTHSQFLWMLSSKYLYVSMFSVCVFACALDKLTWPLQGSFIRPMHGSHLPTSISQTALGGKKKAVTELIITLLQGHKPCVCNH